MKDRLACTCARVDDCPIAALGKSLLVGDARCYSEQVAERRFIFLRGVVERVQMVARDDKDVNGRLRVGITKGEAAFVLVNDIGWSLARDDAAKETIHKSRIQESESRSQNKGESVDAGCDLIYSDS